MKRSTQIWACSVAVGMAFSAIPLNSHAALQIAFSINGVQFPIIVDNGAGDTDPALNSLNLGTITPIPGLTVTGSTHTAVPGTGSINILTSGSASVTNLTGAPANVLVTVGATNFTPPVTQAFRTGSGTFSIIGGGATSVLGSNITLTWCDDPTNAQGADFAGDCPGTQIGGPFTFVSPDAPLAAFAVPLAGQGPFPVNDPALFSMTEQFQFILPTGTQLTGRAQSEVKPHAQVPEPNALSLISLALIALGYSYRKRLS